MFRSGLGYIILAFTVLLMLGLIFVVQANLDYSSGEKNIDDYIKLGRETVTGDFTGKIYKFLSVDRYFTRDNDRMAYIYGRCAWFDTWFVTLFITASVVFIYALYIYTGATIKRISEAMK